MKKSTLDVSIDNDLGMVGEASDGQEFLLGGGEMGALMRAHNWSTSPLGDPSLWPQSLRTTVSLMLNSKYPMFVAWGPELPFLYNDGYRPTFGAKHPAALGLPFRQVWLEIWDDIWPLIERALAGEATFNENLHLVMERHGYPEDTWYTFSYSPVRDESGGISGMFCACTETTRQVFAERRQAFRLGFEERLRDVASDGETMAVAAELLGVHFSANRAGYSEFETDGEHVRVETDWCAPGVASVAGRHRLDSFGSDFVASYQTGHAVVIDDFDNDPRTAGLPAAEAHSGIEVKAQIVVPLVKASRLVALLFVHSAKPRRWSDDDVALVREVAERTWTTVERARALAALSESEARFRRTADTAPALLWVTDTENRCSYLSRSWYEHTGQTPAEAEGFGWLEATHPEDSERTGTVFLAAASQREPFRLEYRLQCADGTYRWAIDAGRPHFTENGEYLGYVGSVIDIHERKIAEAGLLESEARFRAAVQAVSGVLWTNNADGQMKGEQPGWAALTGQTVEQYQGYGWVGAVHPEDAQGSVEAWNAAVDERNTFIFEHRLRCADGRWRRFAIRAIPVLHGSVVSEWVGVHTDITDQREAEAVLSRGKAELERLVEERTAALLREVEERRKAEEALRQGEKLQAIGQLTGGIAHDFNNIMQVVTSGAALMRLPHLPENKRTVILDGMTKAAKNAKELTDRLLSFARKQTLQPEAFDLNTRLGGMSELLRQTLGSRIEVKTDFADDLALAMADPSQLDVAILNLAVNARDAMLPDGGTLTLQSRNARLEATSERTAGEYVCLAVKDTGQGMSPAVMARVFEPFFTTKGLEKGTGLGLAQVHGFAKQSNGDIAIESIPGQGTTITLHLPRATEAMQRIIPTRVDLSGAVVQRAAGKMVLVVDDNVDVAAFAASMLEGLGYLTRTASDAASALALLQAGEPVDAVFSDVVMPGEMNGVQLANLLRLRFPHLALVLATGYSEVLADGSIRTVAEVLGKPYRLDDLAAALERAFAAVAVLAIGAQGGSATSSSNCSSPEQP